MKCQTRARYNFNYSRIDQTRQLVSTKELNYHTANPNKVDTNIYTAPRHYCKIDIADYDPENYMKKVVKRSDD
jgi:hypothetical protein